MTGDVACFGALLVAALASPALAAESWPTLTVEAGKYDRTDTPVCVAVADLGGTPPSFVIQETRGGEAVAVPHQVEPGPPARLWWVLDGKTPAGTSRTFTVRPAPAADSSAPAAQVRTDPQGLDVLVGGAKVLRYRTAVVQPPQGVEATFARNAYICPAWTPAGLDVTDDFPPDHLHQRGLWMSWTKTEFEGRHPDFWNLGTGSGLIRFVRMGPTVSGPVFAAFQPEHEYVDPKAPGGEKVILKETWQVRVWNVGGPAKGYWLWDLESTQRCASASPLHLPKYHYGGLGYRGHRDWLKEVRMLTSEGKTRGNGNETKARWVDVSGPLGEKGAGTLILSHPQNFRHPEPVRLNPQQPQICFAPSQEGDWAIEPGKDYVWRYRVAVHDGQVQAPEADRLWADFAEPPTVKVKR